MKLHRSTTDINHSTTPEHIEEQIHHSHSHSHERDACEIFSCLLYKLWRHASPVDPESSGAAAASIHTSEGADEGMDGSGAARGHFPPVRRQTPPATSGATHYAATSAAWLSDRRLNWVTFVTVHSQPFLPRTYMCSILTIS